MLFARLIQKQMREQGCLDEQGNMNMPELVQAYRDERLDIQQLCSALGRQSLDQSFLNQELGEF